MIFTTKILYGLLGLSLITFTVGAQSLIEDSVPLNRIQVIGSHNSYKKAIEPDLYDSLLTIDKRIESLQYEHISILEQLDMGLRNLEIDVYADSKGGKFAHPGGLDFVPPIAKYDTAGVMRQSGFKILHMPDLDFRTHYYTLKECLLALKSWSGRNPDHIPVFITFEAKDGGANKFGTQPEKFTKTLFDKLDQAFQNYLGVENIITPDMVRGNFETLEEAVLHSNWPTMKESKGKFLIVLNDRDPKMSMYTTGHPSLRGRMMFVNADPGVPEAAVMFRNDPKDVRIQDLVRKGYIIRTRADAGTEEARKNDFTRFDQACKSGAQIITTDYYLPSTFFKSQYKISFEGGSYVRYNPINK